MLDSVLKEEDMGYHQRKRFLVAFLGFFILSYFIIGSR